MVSRFGLARSRDRRAGQPLANLIPDPNGTDPQAESGLTADVLESLAKLEERERLVIDLRFGLTGGEARPCRRSAAMWG
jgi:DNA-directed RNA polymerase sigma subunit (sigma70/sigma32)